MAETREELIIAPKTGWSPINAGEVWRYRELLYFLAWRDLKVKYKQTAIGVIWALLQPLVAMVVYTFIFSKLAGMPSDGTPYPVFVLAGLLPWNYFASVLNQCSNNLVANSNLISKIYFPKIIIPFSSAFATILDFLIGSVLLTVLMFWYGITPGYQILLVPVLVFITLISAVGFGVWLSALNVRYRDVQHAVPFIIQIWMFATPVIYPRSLLGEQWGWALFLNPMGGIVESFRAALIGGAAIPWAGLSISVIVSLFVFATGVAYFRKVERLFADII